MQAQPSRVHEVAALCKDRDPLVAMRAYDLLEKLAHDNPAWVSPVKRVFLDAPDDAGWEVRLQVVRALPLFEWTAGERARVIATLERDARHPRMFVRAWAADGLARLARVAPEVAPRLDRVLAELESSGAKSLLARARAIRRARAAPAGAVAPAGAAKGSTKSSAQRSRVGGARGKRSRSPATP